MTSFKKKQYGDNNYWIDLGHETIITSYKASWNKLWILIPNQPSVEDKIEEKIN
jgi:hypothetical protein